VRLGLLIEGEEGLTWDRWRVVLNVAERVQFDSVWISDHLESPWASEQRGLEAWSALTFAAAQTRRIRMGSLVSPVTFRHPALLARSVESVNALARGRLTLGLGLGWNAEEHARAGLRFPAIDERARMLQRTVEKMLPDVRLLIGGAGRRSLELAARFADAWNMTTASPETFGERAAELDQLCAQPGRDRKKIEKSIAAGILIGRDSVDLRERCRRMQQVVPPLADVELDQVPAAARERGWIVGTPREVVTALDALARAGVDLAILGHYDVEDVDVLELIADRVMPALA
jgi:alkanesulfonate monooxygenase SsuD/methylene tetrahydromethanopterin reductase-like flavin-dependent oxidoreductase (luciferase family)